MNYLVLNPKISIIRYLVVIESKNVDSSNLIDLFGGKADLVHWTQI
jgi:hypothetical protein